MDDYRVRVGWRNHPKRKILESIAGREAVLCVMDLWEFCACSGSRNDGNLAGMSNRAIAVAAGWVGDPGVFVAALTDPEVQLLDGGPGAYRIHDWHEHNPYVAGHEGRSESASANAHAKWHKAGKHAGRLVDGCQECEKMRPDATRNATRNAAAMRNDAAALRVAEIRYAPSPDPDPSPSPDPALSASAVASMPDVERIASEHGWGVQLGPPEVKAAMDALKRGPAPPEVVAAALAKTHSEKRDKPLLYFLGALRGMLDDIARGTGPPRRSRAASKGDQAIEDSYAAVEAWNASRG
jgi:hypothetical protein